MSKSDTLHAIVLALVAASALLVSPGITADETSPMELKRLTQVIYTDDVDGCVAFWTDRLGFEITMAVPAQQPDQTGSQFAGISNGTTELMYQSFAAAEEEAPGLVVPADPRSFTLFLEVDDLDAAISRMAGLTPVVERHQTFYGADEISYRSNCGTIVTFAQFAEPAPAE
jgi:catechol 2,3-dioxygenase-like lactoylglutathione lyase family enzyme